MTATLGCVILAVIAGILSFIIEKIDSIPVHIDHYHDPALAAITGATFTFFISIILITITNLTL